MTLIKQKHCRPSRADHSEHRTANSTGSSCSSRPCHQSDGGTHRDGQTESEDGWHLAPSQPRTQSQVAVWFPRGRKSKAIQKKWDFETQRKLRSHLKRGLQRLADHPSFRPCRRLLLPAHHRRRRWPCPLLHPAGQRQRRHQCECWWRR